MTATASGEVISSSVNAWKILSCDQGVRASHPALSGIKYEMGVHSGFPEIIEWRPLESGVHFIMIYKAGGMGSGHNVLVTRAKIINVETKVEILDRIWEYRDMDGNIDKDVSSPKWAFFPKKVVISDSSSNTPTVFHLD